MKYLDGILAPGTIACGAYARDGQAWGCIGKYVWPALTPALAADFLQIGRAARPNVSGSTVNRSSKILLPKRQRAGNLALQN